MERLLKNALHGVLAQLGERGLCKPEVRGSIPLYSTMIFRSGLFRAFLLSWEIEKIILEGETFPEINLNHS